MQEIPNELLLQIASYSDYQTTISTLKCSKILSVLLKTDNEFWELRYSRIGDQDLIVTDSECHHIDKLHITVVVLQRIVEEKKYNLAIVLFNQRIECQKSLIKTIAAKRNTRMLQCIINNCELSQDAVNYFTKYYYLISIDNDYDAYMLKIILKTDYDFTDLLNIQYQESCHRHLDIIMESDKFIPHQHLIECHDWRIQNNYNEIINHRNYNEREMFRICENGHNNILHQLFLVGNSVNYLWHIVTKDLFLLFLLNFSFFENNLLAKLIYVSVIHSQYLRFCGIDETLLFGILSLLVNLYSGQTPWIIMFAGMIYYRNSLPKFAYIYFFGCATAFELDQHRILIPVIIGTSLYTRITGPGKNVLFGLVPIINFCVTWYNIYYLDLFVRLIITFAIVLTRRDNLKIVMSEIVAMMLSVYIFNFHPDVFVVMSMCYNFVILNNFGIPPYLVQLFNRV